MRIISIELSANPGKSEISRSKYLETGYFLAKNQENNL